jgi:hypothetical protein
MPGRKGGSTSTGSTSALTDAHDRQPKPKPKKVVVKKPKAPPIPVPSMTAGYETKPIPDKKKPSVVFKKPPSRNASKVDDYVPPPGNKHLPTQYEYMSPEALLTRALGKETAAETRGIKKYNQDRERERRDTAKAERQARKDRREVIRQLSPEQRKALGRDGIKDFIENGPADPGLFDVLGQAIKAGASALRDYVTDPDRWTLHDLTNTAKGVKSAAGWWMNDAPDAVLGEYEKGKGYQGGLAGKWEAMSTEEQLDTIFGGKSTMNILQGQDLSLKNIATGLALAALVPVPIGKGLPSLFSVLVRAGVNAREAKYMLETGKGLREALASAGRASSTLKKPIRPIHRLTARAAPPKAPLTALKPSDQKVIDSWDPDRARVGRLVVAHSKQKPHPSLEPIHTVALRDEKGAPRAVAAFEFVNGDLVVSDIAGAGKGGGRAMMHALAEIASAQGSGVRVLEAEDAAIGFYERIGMTRVGKRGFEWTPEEATDFALRPLPEHAVEQQVDPLFDEAGFFRLAGFKPRPVPVRTLTVGDKTQQMPAARSMFTRYVFEKPADWASLKLADEESKAAAALRRVLPTASAEARVAKGAGRELMHEANRANARMLNYVNDLPDAGSAEDFAHFWWAQLPADQRTAEGLARIRDTQRAEAALITSGRALEHIKAQMAAVKAQLRETEDLSLKRELEELKLLAADLPARLEDLAVSIAKFDEVIASPPALNPKVIAAVRGLSQERKDILTRAGLLTEDTATNREGLLARWLGLEPSGDEVFIGHRLGKVRGAQSNLMPVSPGVGKARVPQGARSTNKLVLARTGRARASTHVAAEDWQSAQTYQSALTARDDLAAMGRPFTGRVPEGWMLVNPKGRAVPPHWKTDHLSKIEELGDDAVREAAEQIMKGFLAEGDGAVDDMLREAQAAGVKWDELRVIPAKTVKRYYGQFTPAGGKTSVGKAYDTAVDFMAASIVFARVGYIPKNIVQNLVMSVPHQGPYMLMNIPRAAQALLDPQLRHLLHAEVGFSGAAHGIGQELRFGNKVKGLPGKAASFVGKIADDPARFSAFIHEAAAAGVIRRYSVNLDVADRAALLNLLTDSSQRPLLNDIRARAVEAMADFSRLTPTQRRLWRRLVIIPGWLYAGSRYPFHFAATHPGRSAAIGWAAAGGPGAESVGLPDIPPVTDLFEDGLPPGLEGIKWGDKTLRTQSLNPVTTPWDIVASALALNAETAAQFANPVAVALWRIVNREVGYQGGTYKTDYWDSFSKNAERLIPNFTFAKDMLHPSGDGRYPDDATRLGRLLREVGIVPLHIASDAQRSEAEWVKKAEAVVGGPLPPVEVNGRLVPVTQVRQASVTYDKMYSAFKKKHGLDRGLTAQETLRVLVATQAALYPSKEAQALALDQKAMTMSDDEARKAIAIGRERMGLTAYGRVLSKLSERRRGS